MIKCTFLYGFACLFLLTVLVAVPGANAAEQCGQPLYGITFTHYKVDPNAHCANGVEAAKVMAEGAIIPSYDKADIRNQVRQDLAQIKSAGYTMIRTVLWFTQDRIIAPWGQVKAPLEADDAQRIKQYGEDIRAAGFKKWLLVTNPGIRNNPACRKVTWGDCYEPKRESANFAFIQSVHDLLAPLHTPDFKLEYDLSGELCPSRWLPDATNSIIKDYLTHLIKWYAKNVSSTDFHISCGGFGDDRTAMLLDIFEAAGVRPNAIDIHFYDTDPALIERKLVPAARLARERKIPLTIGEMQYENSQEASTIRALAKRNGICFSALIQWPRRGTSMCQMNVSPPFSADVLHSITSP